MSLWKHVVECKDFADGWIKTMETGHLDFATEEAQMWQEGGHATRITTTGVLSKMDATLYFAGPFPRDEDERRRGTFPKSHRAEGKNFVD